jgi:hypothetical protein
MGTYLTITAKDNVLEQIAGTTEGSAAVVRALYHDYMDQGVSQDDMDVWEAANTKYRAGVVALGPNGSLLDDLVNGDLGRLHGFATVEAAGHEAGCGGFDLDTAANRALALDVLRAQRRRWGTRQVLRLGGTRGEYAASIRHQRLLCERVIAAAQRGDITSLGWG